MLFVDFIPNTAALRCKPHTGQASQPRCGARCPANALVGTANAMKPTCATIRPAVAVSAPCSRHAHARGFACSAGHAAWTLRRDVYDAKFEQSLGTQQVHGTGDNSPRTRAAHSGTHACMPAATSVTPVATHRALDLPRPPHDIACTQDPGSLRAPHEHVATRTRHVHMR